MNLNTSEQKRVVLTFLPVQPDPTSEQQHQILDDPVITHLNRIIFSFRILTQISSGYSDLDSPVY